MRPPVLPGMSLPGVFLSGVLLSGVLLSGMILSGAAQAADSAISSTLRASGLSAGPMALPDYAEGEALDIVPILRWSRRLPGRPPAASSRSEPAGMLVVGDRIYTGYSGSNSLLVLSRRDGTLIRYLPANGPVSSAPVLVGTDLYYTDAAGYTTCFDLQAEQTRWSRYSGAPVLASAVVEDGAVYVTNVDDQVYALDAMTGELRWRYAHRIDTDRASRLTLYSAPSVTLDGDQVVAGFSDGQVVGIGRAGPGHAPPPSTRGTSAFDRWTLRARARAHPRALPSPPPRIHVPTATSSDRPLAPSRSARSRALSPRVPTPRGTLCAALLPPPSPASQPRMAQS